MFNVSEQSIGINTTSDVLQNGLSLGFRARLELPEDFFVHCLGMLEVIVFPFQRLTRRFQLGGIINAFGLSGEAYSAARSLSGALGVGMWSGAEGSSKETDTTPT